MQQLGFDIAYHDPVTHELVPWADANPALCAEIAAAPWKVVDVETTGLNPTSKPQNFTGKDVRRGVNPALRLRVTSVLYPHEGAIKAVACDHDQVPQAARSALANAALTNIVFAHNAGFDAYWLRAEGHRKVMPALLLDSMLIARALIPEQPLALAHMANDPEEDPTLQAEAKSVFIQERSGWSLADLALSRLRRILPKDLQGPKNWCEPFLTQQNYDYALDDVRVTYALLCDILEVPLGADIGQAYLALRETRADLRLVEPQVADVLLMRETGMPWSVSVAQSYVSRQAERVKALADELIAMEPGLARFRLALGSMGEGISAELKQAMGEAFTRRGLMLERTRTTGAFKVGEKDLRRSRAQVSPDAKALFSTWVGIQKAKKAAGMAQEFTGFAQRSTDGRLHPNTGHGPVTGRLASSEPNAQQAPRDQDFRDGVTAKEGHKIVAVDFSALDMRVGAALAIRAQRQIFEAYMGDFAVAPDVARVISRVVEGRITPAQAVAEEQKADEAMAKYKLQRETVPDSGQARKRYWARYRELARTQLLAHFVRCYAEVRERAQLAGTAEWGSLRDAFDIDGMDIHSWTALSMRGEDPKARFGALDPSEVGAALKAAKAELGDARQTGKVGNLSLLYAMKTLGLVDAAAKNYNIHWSFEEADSVRVGWLRSYVEVDLWHAWTELNPHGQVYIPDADYGGEMRRKPVFRSVTLGGRIIYAFGLNAALSYEDQSTGADILGTAMDTFRREHADIFKCIINQVHDEVVFEMPADRVEEMANRAARVMAESAEKFLRPYGVKADCSPVIGDTWLKD